MESKNSTHYGRFDGFKVPIVPKALRSLKITSPRKSSDGCKMCAFDLLAAVADQLLEERESSTSSTSPKRKLDPTLKESPQSDNDSGLEHVSDVKTSCFFNNNVKLEPCESKNVDKMEGDLCDLNLVNSISEILTESVKKQNGDLNKSYSSVNVKMGSTDDDENSFRLNHKIRAFRAQSRTGYRRIRKMLTSRYRKVSLKKDYEVTNC